MIIPQVLVMLLHCSFCCAHVSWYRQVIFVGPLSIDLDHDRSGFELIIGVLTMARMVRSTRILYSIKTTRSILRTFMRLVPDFAQLFGMLWVSELGVARGMEVKSAGLSATMCD